MGPQKQGLMGILTSSYFKWGMVAFGALILIAIIGSMMGGGETLEDKCIDLLLRLDNTNELVIDEYQPYVKSSKLRSLSASLKGVYSSTSYELGTFLAQAFEFDKNKLEEKRKEAALLEPEALADELFKAKINGLLDRTYAHKMALEIYSVMSDEMSIYNSTDGVSLRELLESSYNSLNNLYTQFNDFSETSK